MLIEDEYHFVNKDSELYLSAYLLKYVEYLEDNKPEYVKEWLEEQNDIYDIFSGLYPEKSTLFNILDSYLYHWILENVICFTNIIEKEIFVRHKFWKNIKYNLIDKKKVNDIIDYSHIFEHNDGYEIEIFLEGLDTKKLKKIISNYLSIWEKNWFISILTNFYKKDKQVEIVTQHIQNLLKDYDKNNLIIKMRDFNDDTEYDYLPEFPVNVLATILYLEKIWYLNLKEIRLWIESFYDLLFVVDIKDYTPIREDKLKLTFTNSILNYKTSIKVFWKQKDLIEVLFKNNWSVSENEAYEYVYWDFRNNDPIRSLIVNTNKKLDQVGYNYKIHKENGKIVLEME